MVLLPNPRLRISREQAGNEGEGKLALCLECGQRCEDQLARTSPSTRPLYTAHLVFFVSPLFGQFSSKTARDGEQVISSPFASAVMARSEIDDIFAAKKSITKVIAQPVVSTSASTDTSGSKKKKKDKKRKRQAEEVQDPGVNEEKSPKKRAVETVHDPSTAVPSVSSSKKAVKPGRGASTAKQKTVKKEKEDLGRFKDSRGTGPRKQNFFREIWLWSHKTLGRKTEEGFAIFKEAELDINPEAGGAWSSTTSSVQN